MTFSGTGQTWFDFGKDPVAVILAYIYIYGLVFTGYAPGYGRLFKVVCLFNLVYGFTGSWRYIGSPS